MKNPYLFFSFFQQRLICQNKATHTQTRVAAKLFVEVAGYLNYIGALCNKIQYFFYYRHMSYLEISFAKLLAIYYIAIKNQYLRRNT